MELVKRLGGTYRSIQIERYSSLLNSYTLSNSREDKFVSESDLRTYDEIFVVVGKREIYIKR